MKPYTIGYGWECYYSVWIIYPNMIMRSIGWAIGLYIFGVFMGGKLPCPCTVPNQESLFDTRILLYFTIGLNSGLPMN